MSKHLKAYYSKYNEDLKTICGHEHDTDYGARECEGKGIAVLIIEDEPEGECSITIISSKFKRTHIEYDDFPEKLKQKYPELEIVIDPVNFVESFNNLSKAAHKTAKQKGWWDKDQGLATFIANLHGEISEAWEWIRKGNPKSDHITEFSGVEEELADEIIRIMDQSEKRGYRTAQAIVAKMEFNKTRSHRHGGKKF